MDDEARLLREKYSGTETPEFEADKKRLAAGEPLAYVIGNVPFLNVTIHLDSRPLIPRAETEHWTGKVIKEIAAHGPAAPHILDLCAGSGAIGVAVAKAIPEAHVTFAELDKSHLPTIAKNLDLNGIPCTRYKVFQSDLFTNISGMFDYILCNPPYIDPALDRTEPSVRNFEPHTALYGGKGGFELIARIITDASEHLAERGQLWIEHEPEHVDLIQEVANGRGFSVETHPDQYNVERYSVIATVPSR